jgi:hypothetical protein
MRGLATDKEFVIGILVMLVAFLIVGGIIYKVWWGAKDTIYTENDLRAECSKWLSANRPCAVQNTPEETFLKYPALREAFGDEIPAAKIFCNCP